MVYFFILMIELADIRIRKALIMRSDKAYTYQCRMCHFKRPQCQKKRVPRDRVGNIFINGILYMGIAFNYPEHV